MTPIVDISRELAYLLPQEQAFWCWSRDGKSIEWRDGRTIAFREEMFAILRRLAPSGLPPFGALVLLLAALRDNWSQHQNNADRIIAGYSSPMKSGSAPAGTIVIISSLLPHRARQELGDVLGDLEAVASLPAELRSNAEAGRALAEMVFAGVDPSLKPQDAARIVESFTGGIEAEQLQKTSGSDADYAILSAELRALSAGLGRVGVEPLTQWMRTGIEQPVEPANLKIPAARRVRGMLSELMADPELCGIAKIARDLLAAIHIPRVLISPEDLPVGGVSDIANRGPLDRLLISELAYDELTLAVRVALNEALYLRRESPAQHPPFARAILIDIGIRTWGVPRLYATAVALALAASTDARGHVLAHRPLTSAAVDRVDLFSRQGVVRHLESLDPSPQPGPSLGAWLDSLARETEREVELETFIVTHADTFDDPAFLRSLRAVDESREWYIATVGRDGAFVLWHFSRAGRRELCRADLNLNEIAGRPQSKKTEAIPSTLVSGDKSFPLILGLDPFPLLLPATIDPRHVAGSRELGVIGITIDRRLMCWTSDKKGGRQLTASIPGGRISAVVVDEPRAGAHVVVTLSRMSHVFILSADLRTGHVSERVYQRNHPLHACMRDGLIFLIYKDHVVAVDPYEQTERIIKIPSDTTWMQGRFFRRRGEVHALSRDRLILVTTLPCVGAFDREDGPWLLLKDGDVVPAHGTERLRIGKVWKPTIMTSVSLLGVSSDADRLAIRVWSTAKDGGAGTYWIDLAHGGALQWQWLAPSHKPEELYRRLAGSVVKSCTAFGFTPRNHFTGMFVTDSGDLALQTWNGRSIIEQSPRGCLVLRDIAGRVDSTASRQARFLQTRAPRDVRYTLKLARWKDGSQAFLDSRGMVHLISSDRSMPQITLALTTDSIAIWASDGHVTGPDFYLAQQQQQQQQQQQPTMSIETAMTLLRSFAARLK